MNYLYLNSVGYACYLTFTTSGYYFGQSDYTGGIDFTDFVYTAYASVCIGIE